MAGARAPTPPIRRSSRTASKLRQSTRRHRGLARRQTCGTGLSLRCARDEFAGDEGIGGRDNFDHRARAFTLARGVTAKEARNGKRFRLTRSIRII